MNILALKLILAPIIIGSASLAGRKWGPAVSGWIVGMPLTSGPVIFFVALSHETAFRGKCGFGRIKRRTLARSLRTNLFLAGHAFSLACCHRRESACIFDQYGVAQNFTFPLLPIFGLVCVVLVDRFAAHAERCSGKGK